MRDAVESSRPDETASNKDTVHIPVVQERVVVDTQIVERTGAQVQMRTHQDEVRIAETLSRQDVVVDRVPSNEIVEHPPQSREEDGVLIVPVVEEVLVRRFRIIEEVHLKIRQSDVDVAETVTLRRQEATVEEDPTPD